MANWGLDMSLAKNVSRLAWCLGALLGLGSGCATLGALSAGHVGCPENEIAIKDDDFNLAGRTWTAECRGHKYYCSERGGGKYANTEVACTEGQSNPQTSSPAPPAAVTSGCEYDTQCKGSRVCQNRQCVDAAAKPPEPAR